MVDLPPSEKSFPTRRAIWSRNCRRGPNGKPTKGRTLRADAWRRLRKNKLAMAGLIWVIFVTVVVFSAGLWVPHFFGDPTSIDTTKVAERSHLAPSWEHPFGTDKLGRDMLSRTIFGGQASLMVGVVAVLISVSSV